MCPTDLGMPEMDGREVARRSEARCPRHSGGIADRLGTGDQQE